ncbi:MAG: hypothetical protein QG566_50 [Patescibacteria group bacterium]|jgi:uncharacterized membrane protein|nr:hypothetical protein [Patescibacteria group bacterium]
MTKTEYFKLLVAIDQLFDGMIRNKYLSILFWGIICSILVSFINPVYIPDIYCLTIRADGDMILQIPFLHIFAFLIYALISVFIFLEITALKSKRRKKCIKLYEFWEQGRTEEELLATKEFKDFFKVEEN